MTEDKDELRDRVEQLEQTVQQQQNTIKKMLPNRRQALKGVGLLAGGGLLGAAGGSASAATGSAGQIGTTSDRPDAFTDTLDSNVVSTEKADTRSGYTDETTNRSPDTWLQNNTGSDLDIKITFECTADATQTDVVLDVAETQSSNAIDRFDRTLNSGNFFSISATVPAGYYYRLRIFSGSTNLDIFSWREQQ